MYSIKPIFKDKAKQALFDQYGFVKTSLLSADQVKTLINCYEKNKAEHQKAPSLHHTSTDTANTSLIIEEDTLIKEIFAAPLDRMMINYKPLVGCFHIKESGKGSATGMHQDPTFVDDERYISANVWVALQDTDSSNGNLYFVKGSNRVSNGLRVTPSSPVYYSSFADNLRSKAVEIPLKAGEAVIFHNATIHGATDNVKDKPRLAATLLICSEEAQWQLYYNETSEDKTPIERYELNLNTFIEMPKNGRPSPLALKERFSYVFPEISEAEFYKKANIKTSDDNPLYTWLSRGLEFFRQ